MSDPRSVAALVRLDGQGQPIMAKGSSVLNGEFLFYTAGRQLCFVMTDEDSGAYIGQLATYDIPDGADVVVAATYDGSGLASGITLYQDGAVVASSAVSSGSYTQRRDTDYPYTFGYLSGALASGLVGRIAIPMIFDVELSADEVSTLTDRMRAMYANTPRR